MHILLFGIILTGGLWMGEGISMANSPAAARNITISPVNVPEQAKYLELLIPMTREDPCYSSYNQAAGDETGIAKYAPIVGYMDEDGYISYSFHMKLEKRSASEEEFVSLVFGDGAYIGGQTHLEYIQNNFGTIKAALVFQIRPRSIVILVNVISNTIFNILLILTNVFFLIPYLIFVIVGETLVVMGEYSVYCRLLSSFSRRRLLAFTITANLLSMLLGLGLNYLLSGAGLYGLVH